MLKVKNKDAITMSLTLHIFYKPCASVSTINFEQVNAVQDFLSASYFEDDTYFTLNRRNLRVSQHFRPAIKMGPKLGKSSLTVN